jgi:(2Fe-2S) ferredoxin
MKSKLVELAMHGAGKIRVSKSGCLGRCNSGPCIVIYPEGVWYSYTSFSDIDRIIEHHLLADRPVGDLLISNI